MDRDLVHRQTAAFVVQHMSLGVAGEGLRGQRVLRVAVVVGVQHMSLRVAGEGLRLGLAVVFSAAHEPGRSGWGRGVPCRPEPSDPPRHPPTRLACAGLGCEDALTHLLNYVFPNVFEVSPHIIQVRHPCSLALCLPACAFVHCSVRARVCASHARTPFPSTLLNALQTRLDLPLPPPGRTGLAAP